MSIEDLFISFETKITRNDSPLLNQQLLADQNKVVELISLNSSVFFNRLLKGTRFTYQELFNRAKDNENILVHGEFEFPLKEIFEPSELDIINDLHLEDISVNPVFSYRTEAKKLLSRFLNVETYFCFYNLYYRNGQDKKTEIAPLFYLPAKIDINKDGDIKIYSTSKLPLFNKSLIKKLKDTHDLDITYQALEFNIDEYIKYVKKIVSPFFFAVEEAISLVEVPLKEYLKLHLLVENKAELLKDNRLESLFPANTTPIHTFRFNNEKKLSENILNELDDNNICSLLIQNEKLQALVTRTLVLSLIKKGNSTAVFTSNKTRLKKDFEALTDYATDLDSDFDIKNYLDKNKNLMRTDTEEIAVPDYEAYFNYIRQIDNAYDWKLGFDPIDFYERLANYTAIGESKFKLDIKTYSKEDMEKDFEFFSYFASLLSLNNISFADHPFYGLTTRADENTYTEIHETLITTRADVSELKNLIGEKELAAWNIEDLSTLQSAKSFIQHIDAIKEYNGFNLDYFNLDVSKIDFDSLNTLKSLFASESSLKLSIDNLIKEPIWKEDLGKLIIDLKGRGKPKKNARKTIRNALKIRDKKNFSSLVQLIEYYLNNQNEIKSSLDPFIVDFGFGIANLDDILEIERAFEFIDSFRRHVMLFEDIDFQGNEKIKLFFEDSEFREKFLYEVLPEFERLTTKLEVDFDKLYSFFDSAERKDYELIEFDALIALISDLINANYNIYLDYYNFIHSAKNVSEPLHEIINELVSTNRSFKNFEVDFFKSIFSAYSLDSHTIVEEFRKNYFVERKKMLHKYPDDYEQNLASDVQTIKNSISNYLDSSTYRSAYKDLKALTICNYCSRVDLIRDKYADVFKVSRPLLFGTTPSIHKELNDVSIILRPEEFNYIDILTILNSCKKLILISNSSQGVIATTLMGPKIRIDSVPQTIEINLDTLLAGLEFSCIKPHLFNLMEVTANHHGYQLKSQYTHDGEIYPLALIRPGLKKPSYLLVPDLALHNNRFAVEITLASWIKHVYDVNLVVFHSCEMALFPEEALLEIIRPQDADFKFSSTPELEEDKTQSLNSTISSEERASRAAAFREKLDDIRKSFSNRKIFNPEIKLENVKINDYILSLLPFPLSLVEQFPPYIKTPFMMMVQSGSVQLDSGFIFPKDRSNITLHSQDKKMDLISDFELSKAIFTYISSFSFLDYDILIKELANVIGILADNATLNDRVNKILKKFSMEKKIDISNPHRLTIFKTLI